MAPAVALADDVVAIRRVAVRGVGNAASIRAQLLACPTPSVRPWIFVRRLTIGARSGSVAPEFTAALARLATAGGGSDVVVFDDFPALAVDFARDLLAGVATARWHWRQLGVLERWSVAEAAIGLLAEQPLEVWAVLERWCEAELLVPIWRQLTPVSAAALLGAVGWATGMTLPERPDAVEPMTLPPRLAPAVAFWRDAVTQAAAPAVASHVAATLSLLRWDPVAMAAPTATARHAALVQAWRLPASGARQQPQPAYSVVPAIVAGQSEPGVQTAATTTPVRLLPPALVTPPTDRPPVNASPLLSEAAPADDIATAWGGALFLINVLNRLEMMRRLRAWREGETPTGWQLLHDLALRLGAPEDDGLIVFLAEMFGDPLPIEPLVTELAAAAADLYRDHDVWPDFACQPGVLRVTASHLDLDLHTTTIDIRIRRAGLDFDPAWVPWLGRVVRFHYPRLRQRSVG
jgi:hypothetical protein